MKEEMNRDRKFFIRESMQRAIPLLIAQSELCIEFFDRYLPTLSDEGREGEAKNTLRILANTMRKTIAMAKGGRINEDDCV